MTRPGDLLRETTAAEQRATGRVYCVNGRHSVPASEIVQRKPTLCRACREKRVPGKVQA